MSKQVSNPEYESSHYDYPIPSREAIRAVLTTQPMAVGEIAEKLQIENWAQEAIAKRLGAMCRDQQIEKSKEGFFLQGKSKLIETEVLASKSGDLSIKIDGMTLLLSHRHSQGLFPHDKVVIRISDPVNAKSKPVPVKVLGSHDRQIVCLVTMQRGKKRLVPFDRRIKHLLEIKDLSQFQVNDVILVTRTEQQKNRRVLQVQYSQRLGVIDDAGIEREIARSLYHLAQDWRDVEIAQSQDEIDAQIANREDWTSLPFVTIDGEDAKDFDDAVYANQTKDGYDLYVAIADVSYYVEPDTTIDQQAKIRGNSVYLPGFVIPMLPERLSNELCSLMPNVNRLALGVKISLDDQANVRSVVPSRVVIRSHARLTYDAVDQMCQQNTFPKDLEQTLTNLNIVAKRLQKRRMDHGAVMLSSQEPIFSFDEMGNVSKLVSKSRNWAHQLIEECMLCANCSVGTYLTEQQIPFIMRAHHAPNADKVDALVDYFKAQDIALPHDPKPIHMQQALSEVADFKRSEAESMVLRTMSQAFYSPNDDYHYALSTKAYTHFTSPIRRYVDLTVHRALIEAIEQPSLDEIARDCSLTERYADEASWFAQAWLKVKLMQQHIGQSFTGEISAVTHFGVFVKLDHMPIEGLVHISVLGDDHYVFDQASLSLVGRNKGKRFIQGKRLTISVKSANLLTQQIDFILAKKAN